MLDSTEKLRAVDRKNMMSALERMPKDFSEGLRRGRMTGLPRFTPRNIFVCGMGGSAIGGADASIYRGVVTSSGSGASLTYSMTATSVGSGAHSDVHTVAYQPGSSSRVWACCDGGLPRW